MNDSSAAQTIVSLFSGNNNFFTVPKYQRRYVWKEDNWAQLYEDITYTISDDNWKHFIGAFVFQKKIISQDNIEYMIIDGQQRIVTIQLILMALIASLNKLEDPDVDKNELDKRVLIIKSLISRIAPPGFDEQRLIIDYDRNYNDLFGLVEAAADVEVFVKDKTSNIVKCFLYFYAHFSEMNFNQLEQFYLKLVGTQYIEFTAFDESYAYSIFETLNARGTQLKQMELLKNYFFHYLDVHNNPEISIQWSNMENILIDSVDDYDNYLFSLFKCRYPKKKIDKEEDLYTIIKRTVNREENEIKSFYFDIINCAQTFVDIVNCNNSDTEVYFLLNYYKQNTNKMYRCALLALFYKQQVGLIDNDELKRLLTLLRNFQLVFNLRGLQANKIENDVYDLAYNVFNSDCHRDIQYYVYSFLSKDRTFLDLSKLPSIVENLRYSNHKRTSYLSSMRYVYLFEMYYKTIYPDYSYLETYQNWTIEHVINDKEDEEYVSMLGNLLVANKELQKLCDSFDYSTKQPIYAKSTYAWIRDFGTKYKKGFSQKDIERRTGVIAKEITKLLEFNINEINSYCEEVNKVKRLFDYLAQNETKYTGLYDAVKKKDYYAIKGYIEHNVEERQELMDILS